MIAGRRQWTVEDVGAPAACSPACLCLCRARSWPSTTDHCGALRARRSCMGAAGETAPRDPCHLSLCGLVVARKDMLLLVGSSSMAAGSVLPLLEAPGRASFV